MQKQRRSIDGLTVRHFWAVSKLYRKEFLLSWLTPMPTVGMGVVMPFIIGKIFSSLATSPTANITPLLISLFVSAALTVITNRIAYSGQLALQPKVAAYLQTEAFEHLLKRSAGFHANRISGRLVSDALDYPNAFNTLSATWFIDILPFATTLLIGLIVIALNSVLLATVLLGMTIIAIVTSISFRTRMGPNRKERHAAGKAVAGHISDVLVNNQTVKAFGSERTELAKHYKLNDTFKEFKLRDWRLISIDGSYRIFGVLAFELIFVLVVVHQIRQDPNLLAAGIFALTYTITMTNRLFQISSMMRSVDEALLQATPITEILQQSVEIQDKPNATPLTIRKAAVTFKDVRFAYLEAKDRNVFAGLNLDIAPGEKIGLIGPSGGGKSTLTRLLLRFEEIQAGSITIDEQDITDVTQESLRKSIAYVPQEPLLFHRSVRDNIAYGKPGATDDEIQHAAKQAFAHDFITNLPDGYNTIVGERGVKLSGGQRQRVAIARAILKDAPILVLDEATSALDSESEQYIQKALQKLMQNRTTLVIAHRLSTIQSMDRIAVLDQGKLVEQGTHADLLKHKGLYAKLWAHQSGGFIEE